SHGHREDEICAACVALLTHAATLYSGDFLAGFTLSDSPAFDEWQYFQNEHLRNTFPGMLERLVADHISQQAWEQAAGFAQRWVGLDPLHEPAQRQLMQVYAWAGRHTAALQQYQRCEQLLARELGVEPMPETRALYEQLKQAERLPSPHVPVRIKPSPQDW